MTDKFGGLASPIPDPVPQPHGAASTTDIPVRGTPDAADTKPEPDTETKPDESKPRPNRDGKTPADTKPVPDAAEKPDTDEKPKPDPKPEPEAKAKPSAGTKFLRAAGIPEGITKHPITGLPGLYKAQWKAGVELSSSALAKAGMKGMPLKTMARLLPGVGAVYGAIQGWNHAKNGDLIGGALNFLGVIPGPIGWVGIAGATAWDILGFGHSGPQMWDQPDGETTHILPASAKDVGGVQQLDQQLRIAQQAVYSFKDGPNGTVWDSNPPAALRLDTPAVEKAITQWLGGIADLFTEVDQVMGAAGEQYFTEYKARLQPHIDAMTGLREQIKPLMAQLTAASDGAAQAYTAVLDANRAAREQLVADGKLSDQGPAVSFSSSVAAAVSTVEAADRNIANMFGEPVAALTPAVQTGAGTGNRNDPSQKKQPVQTAPSPAAQTPVTPTSQTPTPAKTETPTKTTDALGDLLRSLNQKQQTLTSPVSTPNLGSGGLGGGSPLNSGGGSPLNSSPSKPLDTSDRKLDDGKKGDEKKEERKLEDPAKDKKEEKKATPLSASQTDNKVTKPITTEQKPGGHTATVPAQPSAATATPNPAAPAAQAPAAPPEQSKQVDVKGQKVEFPDAKTAKLASLLANADPAHPLSLAEAAKAAGLTPPVPGQDPGSQVAPAQAKPGDLLVAGDKSYLLLGDGKFYDLQEYKVVSADQLPQDMGSRGGYFHLNDPSPAGAPGTQPVSGQTAGVDQQVPGGTPAPSAPADASSPKPNDPAPGAPAPAPAGGVPSTGTPGAPKPAPSGGPSSAASTETGTGQTSPSPSTNALDPNAVR